MCDASDAEEDERDALLRSRGCCCQMLLKASDVMRERDREKARGSNPSSISPLYVLRSEQLEAIVKFIISQKVEGRLILNDLSLD